MPKTTYETWLFKLKAERRGVRHCLNDRTTENLPEAFMAMTEPELPGCWIARVLDALAFEPAPPLGHIAKALTIVAERLHLYAPTVMTLERQALERKQRSARARKSALARSSK